LRDRLFLFLQLTDAALERGPFRRILPFQFVLSGLQIFGPRAGCFGPIDQSRFFRLHRLLALVERRLALLRDGIALRQFLLAVFSMRSVARASSSRRSSSVVPWPSSASSRFARAAASDAIFASRRSRSFERDSIAFSRSATVFSRAETASSCCRSRASPSPLACSRRINSRSRRSASASRVSKTSRAPEIFSVSAWRLAYRSFICRRSR